MARGTWYRLDNIGKYYSAQAGSSAQTVFRCAATLTDDIDEKALQLALDRTIEAFPSFNVCLRSGMFWHYLEQSDCPPTVSTENLPICFGLHVDVKSVLFRVTWYRSRINLEVSHIVSDGRGTLSFFKTLLYQYVQERYGIESVPYCYDGSNDQKSEDSYNKYYEKGKTGSSPVPKVFRLQGWHDVSDPTFMEYHLPTSRVLALAHQMGVSLTSLVVATAICAVRTEMPQRDRHRAIRLDIPVDLRQIFDSATTKNFFGLAYISYIPGDVDEPLDDVARQVQDQLRAATRPEALKPRMNRMVSMEKNPFLRLAPLFAKDVALDFANRMESRRTTMTVSNLGRIEIDPAVMPYVRDIDIMTSTTGLSFVLCSYGDDLSIGISTIYASPDVIKNFCRLFSDRGVEGYINSSRTYERSLTERVVAAAESTSKRTDKATRRAERRTSKAARKATAQETRAAKTAAKQEARSVTAGAKRDTKAARAALKHAARSAGRDAKQEAKTAKREARQAARSARQSKKEAGR